MSNKDTSLLVEAYQTIQPELKLEPGKKFVKPKAKKSRLVIAVDTSSASLSYRTRSNGWAIMTQLQWVSYKIGELNTDVTVVIYDNEVRSVHEIKHSSNPYKAMNKILNTVRVNSHSNIVCLHDWVRDRDNEFNDISHLYIVTDEVFTSELLSCIEDLKQTCNIDTTVVTSKTAIPNAITKTAADVIHIDDNIMDTMKRNEVMHKAGVSKKQKSEVDKALKL